MDAAATAPAVWAVKKTEYTQKRLSHESNIAQKENCHSEPVRTLAWESPGFSESFSSIQEIATPVTSVTGSQ